MDVGYLKHVVEVVIIFIISEILHISYLKVLIILDSFRLVFKEIYKYCKILKKEKSKRNMKYFSRFIMKLLRDIIFLLILLGIIKYCYNKVDDIKIEVLLVVICYLTIGIYENLFNLS